MTVVASEVASMMDFVFETGRPPGLLDDLLTENQADPDQRRNAPDHRRAEAAEDTEYSHILFPRSLGNGEIEFDLDRTERLADYYAASSDWLWYSGGEISKDEAPLFHDRRRLCVSVSPREDSPLVARGGSVDLSVLVLPSRGVGVATAWIEGSKNDPWERKHRLWEEHEARWSLFQPTGAFQANPEGERHYPFMAVELDVPDLDRYREENAGTVSRWLTGNYEDETPEAQRQEVEPGANLSRRRYEQFIHALDRRPGAL